jgi:putative ABC transport system ATP-binding protein
MADRGDAPFQAPALTYRGDQPRMDTPPVAVEARAVSRVFRNAAGQHVFGLRDLSFSAEEGSFTVISGPSGSGKSTLLALLGALDRPTSGEVRLFGQSLQGASEAELSRVRRRIGFIFQTFPLLPRLAVWENVSYPLIPRGVSPRQRYEAAERLLGDLDLELQLRSRPEELSGGEQQRVAFARALIADPELLLADEPTSNLDPDTALILVDRLQRVNERGTTVVLVTHDPQAAPAGSQSIELLRGSLRG